MLLDSTRLGSSEPTYLPFHCLVSRLGSVSNRRLIVASARDTYVPGIDIDGGKEGTGIALWPSQHPFNLAGSVTALTLLGTL